MSLLEGKIVIITGAASDRGMGRATALKMGSEGATVVVTDKLKNKDIGPVQEVVDQIIRDGGRAFGIGLDVTNDDDIKNLVDQVIAQYGRIDILFNNAGVPAGVGDFLNLDESDWRLAFDVHVFGMVKLIKAVLPHMIAQGAGVIVNNASTAGLAGLAQFSGYGASKFAVVGLTKHLAAEYGSHSIRINCVCPGMIDTAMSDIEVSGFMKDHNVDRDTAIKELSMLVPLGKYGDPAEVADAVVFLSSDQSKYITGIALPVAGGMSAGL
ncbi:SDR family oxidoreductase [Lutimonas saemankumensis]|uniref:SDR family NAD(P)-dependent oxidoreductase n=1 Tax=Lutimonas saemankumensis TaxID=483016 RepID=UPI001CD47F32|nr:SDR family NAD(P)-dependent oxidoreductase [Lutimonas saemankumensis]MCA0933654.1 SDR family oxidoreductase [Lutimonas saemankumensis]